MDGCGSIPGSLSPSIFHSHGQSLTKGKGEPGNEASILPCLVIKARHLGGSAFCTFHRMGFGFRVGVKDKIN